MQERDPPRFFRGSDSPSASSTSLLQYKSGEGSFLINFFVWVSAKALCLLFQESESFPIPKFQINMSDYGQSHTLGVFSVKSRNLGKDWGGKTGQKIEMAFIKSPLTLLLFLLPLSNSHLQNALKQLALVMLFFCIFMLNCCRFFNISGPQNIFLSK